jgi:DNA-directed RNA polymerase specialized sigma24 family protein
VGAARSLATNEGSELVRRCRAGDGAAWEEIVQTYSRRVYNLAYRFTSRADSAEDLTQDVFVRSIAHWNNTTPNKATCKTG